MVSVYTIHDYLEVYSKFMQGGPDKGIYFMNYEWSIYKVSLNGDLLTVIIPRI